MRCQPITVAGLTIARASRQSGQKLEIRTQNQRSDGCSRGRGVFRFSTARCRRTAKLSKYEIANARSSRCRRAMRSRVKRRTCAFCRRRATWAPGTELRITESLRAVERQLVSHYLFDDGLVREQPFDLSPLKALIEAKIESSDLDEEQVHRYLQLARESGVTLSTRFAARPDHSPISPHCPDELVIWRRRAPILLEGSLRYRRNWGCEMAAKAGERRGGAYHAGLGGRHNRGLDRRRPGAGHHHR